MGSLDIASDAFVSAEDGWAPHEFVLLSGDFDNGVAVEALRRAGARFMLVDEEGREYPTEESLAAGTLEGPRELYSPNYVADPKILDNGIELYVDCKGVIPPPMAATFRRIVREELVRARITNAKVRNAPN
ncbi:MAG TPA: hypothetical protein VM121_09755 [Acidimicrobiales bacterium]|nr:hypothetical protein [Acidimicrobiales bacterium]